MDNKLHIQPVNQFSSRIRVAFVLWTLKGMGGSEHVVYDIVRKLDKSKFQVLVIGLEEGPVRNIYEKIGVSVAVVSKSKKFDLNFIKRFRHILLSEKIDIVNPHHFSPLLYTTLATINFNIAIAYTEHSVWQYKELNFIKKLISNILFSRINAVIAISKQLFVYYTKNPFVSKKKINLIINGINLNRFKKFDCSTFKKSLGFDSNDKLIGVVANLRPEKNHKVLIRAFSKLSKSNPSLHLVFAGLDCMHGELKTYAKQFEVSESVHFLGSRDDIPEVLNILDIFCLPSKNEGLPLTLLEAMACEVPVIGADVMGINEVVVDNVSGLLFPYDNEKILIEKIGLLLTDHEKREKLTTKALVCVEKSYCLDEKIKQYESLFRMLFLKESSG